MYVYILECSDHSFYTGVTNDIDIRLKQHQNGADPGSYTYNRRPVILKFYEKFQTPMDAILMEKKIKGWTRAKKIALIEGKFDLLPLLSACKNKTSHKHFRKSEED